MIRIPQRLHLEILENKIPAVAVTLYRLISMYKTDHKEIPLNTLIADLGLSEKEFRSALNKLIENKFIAIEKRPGKHTKYKLLEG